MKRVAATDPYTGLHPESVYAMWHDPTTYDHASMGPPYLPEPKATPTMGRQASMSRYCEFWKASNGKWYMNLASDEHGEHGDADTYGPFSSEDAAIKYLHDNFSNPGAYDVDDSGTEEPPTKSPNGSKVVSPHGGGSSKPMSYWRGPHRRMWASSDLNASPSDLLRKEAAEAEEELSQILQHFVTDYGNIVYAELPVLLVYQRACAQIHQAHHWQTSGPQFYGDHLLYERLYGDSQSLIDSLAERSVGVGHPVFVHPVLQAHRMVPVLKTLYGDAGVSPSPEEMPLLSLRAELRFLVMLKLVYDSLEKSGVMSHGVDNLLQGIGDKHEEFVYLLKQRAGARTASHSYAR